MAYQYLPAYDPTDEEDAIRGLASAPPPESVAQAQVAPSEVDHGSEPDQSAVRGLASAAADGPSAHDSIGHTATTYEPGADSKPLKSDPQAAAPHKSSPFGNLNGWAIVADLLTNRGRGLGSILATAHDQDVTQSHDEKQAARDAIENEGRKQQIQLGYENASIRRDEASVARDRELAAEQRDRTTEDMRLHPEKYPLSHDEQIRKDQLDAMSAERKTDNARADSQLEETKRHDKATETISGGNAARADARQALIDERAAAAAARADEHAARAADHQKQTEDTATERLDNAEADRFLKSTSKTSAVLRSIEQANKVIAKYKAGDVPGLGIGQNAPGSDAVRGLIGAFHSATGRDDSRNQDAQTIHDALTNGAQALLHQESGAVFRPSEEDLAKARTGSGTTATEEQAREAMRVIAEASYHELAGQAGNVRNKDRIRSIVQAAGLDPERVSPQQARALAENADKAAPPPAAPDSPNAAPPLPVVRGKQPKVRDYLKFQKDDDDLGVSYGR